MFGLAFIFNNMKPSLRNQNHASAKAYVFGENSGKKKSSINEYNLLTGIRVYRIKNIFQWSLHVYNCIYISYNVRWSFNATVRIAHFTIEWMIDALISPAEISDESIRRRILVLVSTQIRSYIRNSGATSQRYGLRSIPLWIDLSWLHAVYM